MWQTSSATAQSKLSSRPECSLKRNRFGLFSAELGNPGKLWARFLPGRRGGASQPDARFSGQHVRETARSAHIGRKQALVSELLGRSDYAIIGEIVEPRTKVLDLGCGEGELLEWLALTKGVDARGVEISSAKVQRAIARGVSVFQSDIDAALADYPDRAFDYVILSQTLQETRHPREVLREMLRVGRRVALEGVKVERRYFLAGSRKVHALPNLMAEVAVYLVSRE